MGVFGNTFGRLYNYSGDTTPIVPPAANTIYIDPNNNEEGRTGLISNPYKNFSEFTLTDTYTYLVKADSIYTTDTAINLAGRTLVRLGTYGTGDKAVLKFTGDGTSFINIASTTCTIDDLEITSDIAVSNILALINVTSGTGNTISNCVIHNAKQGSIDGGMGIRGGSNNLTIYNCEVYDCGADGIYLAHTTGLDIGYCNVHHINQNYAGVSKGFLSIGTGASGDGIQLDGVYTNFKIHHTTIDRTDVYTGNKFPLILGGIQASAVCTGVVEHCIFKVSSARNMDWAVYCGNGTGVIFRYNEFQGTAKGLRLIGTKCINYLIHNNIFSNCTYGIGVVKDYSVNIGNPSGTMIFNNVFAKSSEAWHIYTAGGDMNVRNNIFDDSTNAVRDDSAGASATVTLYNNCFEDISKVGNKGAGTNSVSGNPLFVDYANNDFHLTTGSPCINHGIYVSVTKDFDGINIPQGAAPDIGAYEFI